MKLVREHINEISLGGSNLDRMGVGMKETIKRWLDKHNVKNYIINDDLTIDTIDTYSSRGNVNLREVNIPDFIKFKHIAGFLDLSYTSITSLSDDLQVDWWLDLNHSKITSLPNGLKVGGSLNLWNTPITSLPNGLKVGHNLNISYTTITTLPADLYVIGMIIRDKNIIIKDNVEGSLKQLT